MSNAGGKRNVKLAKAIATWAHTGYTDKNGYDYISHPAAVAAYIAADDPYDWDGQIVAWLHDVVEDTDLTIEVLGRFFPDYITDAILLLSRNLARSGDGYYVDIRDDKVGIALRVKLKDIQHNTSSKRMEKLNPATRERLTAKYEHALEILNG